METQSLGGAAMDPKMVTKEELVAILEKHIIEGDPREKNLDRSSKLVMAYLLKNEPEFRRVTEFRNRGWIQNKEKGDAFFKAQREKADYTDEAGEKRFYNMMQQIAEEMHGLTGVLNPPQQDAQLKTLDVCMAPGGYTAAIIKHHPRAKAFGITLSHKQGGHPLHFPINLLAGFKELDVTLLAREYMDDPVPKTHPGHADFLILRPFNHYKFDLVFCDGMVLRTQERPTYREENEVTRLSCSQMILALQRIAPGGTMVMLLHKVDSFAAANILYTFSKFASVDVFKPVRKHGTRSSFYMIAKDVRPQAEAAVLSVKEWKGAWWKATFGGEDGTGEKKVDPPESYTMELLENYGERLIEMGRGVWKIQADALSRTDYAGDGSAGSRFAGEMMNSPPKTPKIPAFRRASWVKADAEHLENISPASKALSSPRR